MELMPTKERREDVFIKAFLTAYEDLSWSDCHQSWVDKQADKGVEMLATRKSDGKTLAIEHTVIEPFVKEKESFAFFERSFCESRETHLSQCRIVPFKYLFPLTCCTVIKSRTLKRPL